MSRGVSLVIAVALGAALLSTACGGGGAGGGDGGNGPCGEPTLAQCQDSSWLETDPCGQAARELMRTDEGAACNQLLAEGAFQQTEGSGEEEVILPPELGGGVGVARIVPNPEEGLDAVNMPLMNLGGVQQAAATATEAGLSAEEQGLRAEWDADGTRIKRCREYVYEKFYDFSRFEDAVAAHYSDTVYLAAAVFGPADDPQSIGTRGAADGGWLKAKDGTALAIGGPHSQYLVDYQLGTGWELGLTANVFVAMPRELLQPAEVAQYQLDSRLPTRLGSESMWMPNSGKERWLWHQTTRAELAAQGYAAVELDAMYANVREFQTLVRKYRAYQAIGTPACCESAPSGDCCTEHQATGTSLGARLRDLFDLAVAAGCLETGTTICSWSPAFLVDGLRTTENFTIRYGEQVTGSFGAGMERAYQRCLARTGDIFTGLDAHKFTMPDGTDWPAPAQCPSYSYDWPTCPIGDYTASSTAFDKFLERADWHDQAVEQYWAQLLASMPRDVFNRQGQLELPHKEWSDNHEAGNSKFGVFYNYSMGWSLPGIAAGTPPPPVSELCTRGPEAHGSFAAGGWAFGSDRVNAIDAGWKAGLTAGEFDAHLTVLDQQIWVPPAVTEANFFVAVNSSVSVSACIVMPCPPTKAKPAPENPLQFKFSVAGWPMSIEAGISGELGIAPVWNAESHPYAPGGNCWAFEAGFKPYLGLDAFGNFNALDAGVVKGGVSIALQLIELGLPITWRISEKSEVDSGTGYERLTLSVGSGADLTITVLAGSIAAFVEVGFPPFAATYKLNIFRWDGIKLASFPLWYSGYTVSLRDLLLLMEQSS